MLTVYKAPRSERSDSSSDESRSSLKIPAGRPYITKVNGRLVMARDKKERTADIALDLLGEAFGPKTRTIIRRRARSVENEKAPLIINGVPYLAQLPPPVTHTASLPQGGFTTLPPMPQQYQAPYPPQQYPPQYPLPYYPGPGPNFILPPQHSKPQPNPTKQDFALLTKMDSHFNQTSEQALKSLNPTNIPAETEKVVATKTTITIVKHVCAECGRLRSRKYHHEHPIKEGETPAADFCRKCQRDASSTSDSSNTVQEDHKKKKGDKKKKKVKSRKHHKKVIESSSEDESTQRKNKKQHNKPKPATKKKTEGVPFDPSEDYIVVEEEFSEDDLRGRRREKTVVEEYVEPSLPPSKADSRAFPRRAHSAAERRDGSQVSRKPVQPPKVRQTSNGKQHRSPSIGYTRVEVPSRHYQQYEEEVRPTRSASIKVIDEVKYDKPVKVSTGYYGDEDVKTYPRKIPIPYADEVDYDKKPETDPRLLHKENRQMRQPHVEDYTFRESEIMNSAPIPRQYSFEERSTSTRDNPHQGRSFGEHHSTTSSQTSEARRRRRRERGSPPTQSWDAPYPQNDDEFIVVTETYGYEPPRHDEETRRRQEYIDRTTLNARDHLQGFSPEDAAKYYHDDWASAEQQPSHRRKQSFTGHRSHLADNGSEESYDYTISRLGNEIPPDRKPRMHDPPVWSRSDMSWFENMFVDPDWEKRPKPGQKRQSSRTSFEHIHKAGAGDTGTSDNPFHQGSRSREHSEEVFEDDAMSSMSERELMAELGARHVTFRSTPSMRSAA